MKNNYRIVDRYKAEKILRFVNAIIDYIFSIIIVMLIYIIALLAFSILGGAGLGLDTALANLEQINPILDRVITAVLYAFLMFVTESVTKGRSIGKFITGTMVVKENGSSPSSNDYLKRNFSRIVPFDTLSFFGTNGWHDSWSDTRVVKRKPFLEALERENSIEDIGQIALD